MCNCIPNAVSERPRPELPASFAPLPPYDCAIRTHCAYDSQTQDSHEIKYKALPITPCICAVLAVLSDANAPVDAVTAQSGQGLKHFHTLSQHSVNMCQNVPQDHRCFRGRHTDD
ncbi:unnamed protein product [Leuciscus chuanchicus]